MLFFKDRLNGGLEIRIMFCPEDFGNKNMDGTTLGKKFQELLEDDTPRYHHSYAAEYFIKELLKPRHYEHHFRRSMKLAKIEKMLEEEKESRNVSR